MPRRKQSQPQAHLGPVESRAEERLLPTPHQEQATSDSDGEAPKRARKRRKHVPRPASTPLPSRLEVHRSAPAGVELWHVAVMPLEHAQPQASCIQPPASDGAGCWLELQGIQAQPDLTGAPVAKLCTPELQVSRRTECTLRTPSQMCYPKLTGLLCCAAGDCHFSRAASP